MGGHGDQGAPRRISRRAAVAATGAGLMLSHNLWNHLPRVGEDYSSPPRGAGRKSRVAVGTQLVHADLHNHTLLSDGAGDPARAFESMRSAGLDVAALTDHSSFSDHLIGEFLTGMLPAEYQDDAGIDAAGWERTRTLADEADEEGIFTAIRGFEWSEPHLGHVNVWFSEHYVDILQAGVMVPFLEWLRREPGLVLSGGADGLAGFNHPGREPGRFQEFVFDPGMRDRMVSLEMFNRGDDYLFRGWRHSGSSPLVACLNAGWRTGLSGVTDEHGDAWGHHEGLGRTGLWVRKHSRAGVREAMTRRRFFATRTSGLRVDATATLPGTHPFRMGSVIPVASGVLTIQLDIARDGQWRGRPLACQVLRPGTTTPTVVHIEEFDVGDVVEFQVPVDIEDGDWVVLRVSDPSQLNATPGPGGHPCNDLAIAYTSPWWLAPA
ncbi:CehA/McbA family metallohydrolase [Nocardioides sp.]|uniref:CehA/McbA family metallohydrolase n=1 Tax=Nocardioides sp. TaxID=35761 RepID=UPI00356A1A9E